MCTKGIRDRVSIDTLDRHLDRSSIDPRSTLDRPSIDNRSILNQDSIDISVPVGPLWTRRRRNVVECLSILAVITRSLSVAIQSTVSIATLWSTVASMAVIYLCSKS